MNAMGTAKADILSTTVDPITVEVIGSALESIAEEMGEALIRASYSTNIKERRDSSTALYGLDGNCLCQAEHIPMHLGSFIEFIPAIMARYSFPDIQPGDVFIGNDAYVGGGTHLPDITIAEPIFVDGQPIAWAINTAHHTDFLDRGHAHIFQEGIRIPPVRLRRAGEVVQDVQDLILLNCQFPSFRLSDLRAQMAANRLGADRIAALCARYGTDTVLAVGAALQDYAERKMRAGIASIPDGTYTFQDSFDNQETDGSVTFKTEIVVTGEEMQLHFESPPQMRAACNMNYTALLATVYYAVKALVDPTIPPNTGLARPIKVTAPLGSMLNCRLPAAVNSRIGPAQRVVDIIHGALAQVVPGKVVAASHGAVSAVNFVGQLPDGGAWGYNETIGGGGGARPDKDGLDGIQVHMTNSSNLPVEALEVEYPITVLRYEMVDGSGGEGKYRGGMALRRVYRADADCQVRVDITRILSRPWGLFGGKAGQAARFSTSGPSFKHENAFFPAGTILDVSTAGGGGYGPVELREEEAVQRDMSERRAG